MKKLVLGLAIILGTMTIVKASTGVEIPSQNINTCYYRTCVTTTGSNGVEFKECSDWKEIDCKLLQQQ